MRQFLGFLFLAWSLIIPAKGQHIYPEKFDVCHLRGFCLDCGDPKASYLNVASYFRSKLPPETIKDLKGRVLVQVLVDSAGQPCALSQTSNLGPKAMKQLDLRGLINTMGSWSPALDKTKPVHTSTTLQFDFNAGQLAVSYRRFDMSKVGNMKSVGEVEIRNKTYSYAKQPGGATLQVFTTQNSVIPWDMMRTVIPDQQNILWVGTDNGVVKIEKGEMTLLNASTSGLQKKGSGRIGITEAAVDKQNNKWLVDGYRTYRYDGTNWTSFDSTSSPLNWTTALHADRLGNVWFGSKGLIKYDGKLWTTYTPKNSKLPASAISGLYSDRQNRLWVGTYKGNIRLTGEQTEVLNDPTTPLAHAAITCAGEDADGTLWFGLYDSDKQKRYSGLAKYTPNGKWTSFTAENSGFPGNDVSDLVVDQQHHVVWASINGVGLCRFDGTTWTLFTPENSAVPSTVISDLALDANGTLWGATHAGLLKLQPH